MLNSDAACSLDSNTKEVLRCSGVARAPVAGSGAAPACSARVSKDGSDGPGMAVSCETVARASPSPEAGIDRDANAAIVCYVEALFPPDSPRRRCHESQRHPACQGQYLVH